MKFLADEMLGTLAKWLRILGYDTAYRAPADDNELVRIARAEGRCLLTRDTELVHRRGVDVFLIDSDDLEAQLDEVVVGLDLAAKRSFSRCPVCNTPLKEVEKESIEERVPPYIFRTHDRFRVCPECEKVYWRGTHWEKMQRRIQDLIEAKP